MRPRIGQILVAEGTVADEAIVRALGYQKRSTEPFRLGSILLGWDLLEENSLLAGLAKLHHCPPVTWAELSRARREALRCLPPNRAMRLGALPYALEPGRIRVAFSDPSNLIAVDEAAQVTGKSVVVAVTTEVGLALAYKKFYGQPLPPQLRPIAQKLERPRATPASPVPIVRSLEAARAASVESGGPDDWPFWCPEELEETHRGPLGAGVAWLREESSIAEPPVSDIDAGEARRLDQIAAPVLEILLADFPRVVVFGVGKSSITGWTGRGPGLSSESVSDLRVPAQADNVFAEVASSGVPHFGPVARGRFPSALPAYGETLECAVFPIRILDSVAGLLYADRIGAPMAFEDFATLARGAASAANLLSGFLQTEGDI